MVDGAIELGGEIDAAVGVGAEVLDVVGDHFVVADDGVDVVGGVDGRAEDDNGADGAGDAADADEVTDLEGAEDDGEDASGEVRK